MFALEVLPTSLKVSPDTSDHDLKASRMASFTPFLLFTRREGQLMILYFRFFVLQRLPEIQTQSSAYGRKRTDYVNRYLHMLHTVIMIGFI